MQSINIVSEEEMQRLEAEVIERALRIISKRFTKPECYATNPEIVEQYLRLHLGQQTREIFTVIYLNHGNGIIAARDMFQGTNDNIIIWPREIAKVALELNANSVILAHNHPSGNPNPSQKDIVLTAKVHEGLQLLGMGVVDHIIVGCDSAHSLRRAGEFNPHGKEQTARIIIPS